MMPARLSELPVLERRRLLERQVLDDRRSQLALQRRPLLLGELDGCISFHHGLGLRPRPGPGGGLCDRDRGQSEENAGDAEQCDLHDQLLSLGCSNRRSVPLRLSFTCATLQMSRR